MKHPHSLSKALESALQVIDRLIDLFHFSDELACIDCDASTATAGKVSVVLKPSDGLLGLSTAVSALNRDLSVVEHEGFLSVEKGEPGD